MLFGVIIDLFIYSRHTKISKNAKMPQIICIGIFEYKINVQSCWSLSRKADVG